MAVVLYHGWDDSENQYLTVPQGNNFLLVTSGKQFGFIPQLLLEIPCR
jgi:hypothetical protein